jgi:hypothetical protein
MTTGPPLEADAVKSRPLIGKEATETRFNPAETDRPCGFCRSCDFKQFQTAGVMYCSSEWACSEKNDWVEYQPIGKKRMQERGMA